MSMTQVNLIEWLKNQTSNRFNDDEISGFHARRRKNGASFILYYRDENGNPKNLTIGKFPSMSVPQAKQVAQKSYAEIKFGKDVHQEKIDRTRQQKIDNLTVLNLLENYYIERLKLRKSGKSSENNIRNHFHNLLNRKISSLSCLDIRNWQNQRKYQNHHHETLVRVFSDFKAMLNYAVKDDFIPENPIQHCKLVKNFNKNTNKKSRTENRLYLTTEQHERLFAALDLYEEEKKKKRQNSISHGKTHLSKLDNGAFVDRVKPSFLILYYQGMRIGDVITLDWQDIDLDDGFFYFTPNKIAHKKPNPQKFKMHPAVKKTMFKWWEQNGNPQTGPVFPNVKTGKYYNKHSFKRVWPKVRTLAGLPENMELQTLRHNFASQLVMKNISLLVVAKLMATSVKMIENNYGKLMPESTDSALNIMPQATEKS